jgi:hypothetical protein
MPEEGRIEDDLSDPTPRTSKQPTSINMKRSKRQCYLCFFAAELRCVNYNKYIIDESPRCATAQIAKQITDDISARDNELGVVSEGATVADIQRHIASHMLHPLVKVPELIRELDDMRRLLSGSISSTDPETGATIIDAANMSLYLKVVREIQQIYKMNDSSKLFLGSMHGGSAALQTDL